MASFQNNVIALTGAASGIGLATARILAARGARLSLADANDDRLQEAAKELRQLYPGSKDAVFDPVLATVIDITSASACLEWIAATVAHFKQPIDGAANLAGVVGRHIGQPSGSVRHLDDAQEWDFVMNVNFKGTLNCIHAELQSMKKGQNGRGGGSIVNAASIAGLVGVENNGPYVASKHAVAGITKTVAKEEGPSAIRCNAIAP
jgi:NAD(P)-dependent dehydrogenase (short-subunit alcohol dehydrogenase family)